MRHKKTIFLGENCAIFGQFLQYKIIKNTIKNNNMRREKYIYISTLPNKFFHGLIWKFINFKINIELKNDRKISCKNNFLANNCVILEKIT